MSSNEGIIPLRVPQELRERCERIAVDRRRATGQNVQWTEVAREFIEAGCRRYERSVKRETGHVAREPENGRTNLTAGEHDQ